MEEAQLEQLLTAMEERIRRVVKDELVVAQKTKLTKLHRIADVGELLGISRSTVYRMRKNGELRGVKRGNTVFIPDEEIQRIALNCRPHI